MHKTGFFCSLIVILLVIGSPAHAQTMYIDDMLKAPLRAGEGLKYRIVHRGLTSGTRVELLETSDSGYSRVRTSDGTTGWLPTRYLSREPIAQQQLETVSAKYKNAQAKLEELQNQLDAVTKERNQLVTTRDQLEERVSELTAELKQIRSVSENALQLNERNKELLETNQTLQKEVEVLTAENERLQSKKESDFMLLGAGLVGLGVIIALLVPWLKPTRKTDTWV